MHHQLLAGFCLSLAVVCGGASLASGQAKEAPKEPAKEAPKEAAKEAPKKEEIKPLTQKDYDQLMKDVKQAQGKMRATIRNKRGADAAAAADEMAGHAAKILLYDGDIAEGANKGKKARDQKDFQGWAGDLKAASEELAKQAKAGKWDKVNVEWEKVGKSCKNCHDVYDPTVED